MGDAAHVVYEIVANEELPVFDPLVKVKQILFTERQKLAFNHLLWRYKAHIIPCYLFGHCLRIAAVFTPAEIGRWFALVSSLLQCPAGIVALLSFRYEYLKLIAHTFEFWFFTATNTIWLACVVLIFQDVRIFLLPVCWLEYQNAVVMDAFFSDFRDVIISSAASSMMVLIWIASVTFHLISDTHNVALLTTNKYTIHVSDVMTNAMGTILILLIRLIYRRRTLIDRAWGAGSQTLQSMGYRCRVRLLSVDVNSEFSAPGPTMSAVPRTTPPSAASTRKIARASRKNVKRSATVSRMLAMRFVKVPIAFDSAYVVAPRLTNWMLPMKSIRMIILYVVGLFCPILTMRLADPQTQQQHLFATGLAITTVVSTVLYCGQFFCMYQRQLLRMVFQSFDFLFLSIQLTIAHLGACELFAWEWKRCMGLLASWIWIHWVMTLDALTPAARQRLAFKLYFAVPVLALRLVLQLLLILDVLLWNELRMEDRLIFRGSIAGRDFTVFLLPFIASRAITNIVWCARLMWRIRYRNSQDELIMLQGNVEYDCSRRHRRSSRSRVSTINSAALVMRTLAATLARKTSRVAPTAERSEQNSLDRSRIHTGNWP